MGQALDNFGQRFGQAAANVAKKMGGTKSLGKCALAVGDALSHVLGENVACKYRGNAWTWLDKVKKSPYWKFLRQSKDTTGLPAGSLVIWNKQPAHPYGHIEVADGKGHLCSDFMRSDKLAIYRSNPANIVPIIFAPADFDIEVKENKLPKDVIVTASALNIRKSASASAERIGQYNKGSIVTIWAIETKGKMMWGKNATGFFCIKNDGVDYVREV